MSDAGPTPPAAGRAWLGPGVVLAVVLALHAVQSVRLFPSWGALVDDERPVLVADHAIHLYHGALGARFVREHATTWGYDPFFMAGYPETPVWDSSSNLAIAFQTLAKGRYSPRAYKLGLFACTLLAVALIPAGARGAGLSWWETAAAAALAATVFWGTTAGMLWRTGLFAFVTASAAGVGVLGLLLRFDARPTVGRWSALTAAGAALLFAHVAAPVVLTGPALGYLAATVRRWRSRRRRLAAVLAGAVVAMVTNAFWLVPLWRFRDIRSGQGFFMAPDSATFFGHFLLEQPLYGRVSLALLVLGASGLATWWREGRRTRAAVFGGGAAVLLTLCWVGGLWSVTRATEPFRFLATLDLLLSIPAGSALVRASAVVARRAGGGTRGGIVAAALVATAAAAAWFIPPSSLALLAHSAAAHRPLVVGLRPEDVDLVRALRAETDTSARVLFEDQLRLLETTDAESTHWTPLLPFLLGPEGRTFVGGLYHSAFITHNRAATFGDYSLGHRRIDTWSHGELRAYCDRYNVGWVVCWSPLSRYCFDNFPTAHPVATLPRATTPGLEVMRDRTQWDAIAAKSTRAVANVYLLQGVNHYRIYRVDRPRSFFLTGSGRVARFDANLVDLRAVTPDPATGAALLSLHWLDTWKADPPVRLSPVFVPGDPVPFVLIGLDRALPRVVLRNGY